MALRGTLTHWKTRILAQELGLSPCLALGVLEALWHVTAELSPAGNIGRLPNRAIGMEMFWEGDHDALIEALITSGHLDIDVEHRLLVHDWHQHSDYNTRRKLERKGVALIGEKPPVAASGKQRRVITRHESIPEPEPEPEPEPAAAAREQPQQQKFPESELLIQQAYPGTDASMVRQIVAKAVAAAPDISDAELAVALAATHKRKHQRSAALWRDTLPPYLATWARNARSRDGPAAKCPTCGDVGLCECLRAQLEDARRPVGRVLLFGKGDELRK